MQLKRKIDISRHNLEVETENCTLDQNQNFYVKPSFNFNSNDKFFKKRHYFKTFLTYLTAVVIKARAEKRFNCLKKMISKVL